MTDDHATDDYAELREAVEAIPENYRGPWRWLGHLGREYQLTTTTHGLLYVMGFERMGMSRAQPTFAHRSGDDAYHLMTKATDVAIREVPYRLDITGFDNPFARWLPTANPSVIAALLDDYDRLALIEAAAQEVIRAGNVRPFREYAMDRLAAALIDHRTALRGSGAAEEAGR